MSEQAHRVKEIKTALQCCFNGQCYIGQCPRCGTHDDRLSCQVKLRQDIEDLLDQLQRKSNKRDWTPCAEGLPTNSARYKVTLQVGSEAGTWLETAIIPYRYCDSAGEWVLPKSDWLVYGVIAWTKADDPYNPDHIREATKKEDDTDGK